MNHLFQNEDELKHDLELVEEKAGLTIRCAAHSIDVGRFNNDHLVMFGGTCLKKPGSSEVEFDRTNFEASKHPYSTNSDSDES